MLAMRLRASSCSHLLLIALAGLLVCGAVAPSAGASQTTGMGVQRVFAPSNAKIDIDGKDDWRVDAGIAILDAGVDLDHPDLNVVAGIECVDTVLPGVCDAEAPEPGNDIGEDGTGALWGHGTKIALDAAAIDNDYRGVGVAPGARIYAVREAIDVWSLLSTGDPWEIHLTSTIAAIKWVTDHADEVDVAFGGIHALCSYEPLPTGMATCEEEDEIEEFNEAVQEMVDAGVVWVVPASNLHMNVEEFVGPSNPNAITVSAMADWDGLPGGLVNQKPLPTCPTPPFAITSPGEDVDDSHSEVSNWGAGVDIAAPGCPTSAASPLVTGAAAVLASADDRDNYETPRKFVEEIRKRLFGDGDCAVNKPGEGSNVGAGNCQWTDDSPDDVQEPLLDMHDEAVFDPETIPGSEPVAVDSDVNGDGRADLVTLRADGVAYTHIGNGEAKFGSGEASFSGSPLDPAQYDGVGHYVIDVADAAGFMGEKRADLVTLTDDGDVHVYAGEADGGFDEAAVTSELDLTPGLLDAGGFEPIAVADVDGGGHADLIAYDDVANEVVVYRGYSEGVFGPHQVVARTGIDSALHTGTGHYFVDAADVTGDNRADLVTMNEGALKVFPGSPSATFEAPVLSHSASIDPAMDDGSGYEPVGLGDVTGDGHADLALVKSGTVYLYPGQAAGSFGSPTATFAGGATSTTFTAGATELLGLFDVDGNGRADITARLSSGDVVRVVSGQANGTFSGAANSSGTFPSTQHFKNQTSSGNEFVLEKPSWRRRGCVAGGCGWVIESVPNAAGANNNRLTDVSCTSSTFCFATGHLVTGSSWGYGRVWNGSSWEKLQAALPSNAGLEFSGVSCISSTWCMTVGKKTEAGGEVLNFGARWNATTWTPSETPGAGGTNNRLTAVSCTSSTFCFATANLISAGTSWAYGLVWDGSAWKAKGGVPENAGTELTAVSCTSSTSCTVVGRETEANGDILNLAVRWNGTSWTRQEVPNAASAPNNRLTDVSCTSSTFCMAIGHVIDGGGVTWAYGRTWNGSVWTSVGGVPFQENSGVELQGVSCTSSTSCTGVGHETEANGDVLTLAAHWDGSKWTREETPDAAGAKDNRLAGVSCVFPGCTAVGSYTDGSGTANLAVRTP